MPLITILIAASDSAEALSATTENLLHLDNHFEKHVIALTVQPENSSVWKAYEKALQKVTTPYVMMIRAGDTFLADALERGCAFFEQKKEEVDAVMFRGSYAGRRSVPKKTGASVPVHGVIYSLENKHDIERMPNCFSGIILRTEAAKEENFQESNGYETREEYIYRILDKKKKIGYIKQSVMLVDQPLKSHGQKNKDNIKADWYLESLQNHILPLQKTYMEKYGELPLFFQYRTVYELKIRFESNRAPGNKYALNEQQMEEFLCLCTKALKNVDDSLLAPVEKPAFGGDLGAALSQYFLDLKYEGKDHPTFYLKNTPVYLDLTNYQDNNLILDFAYPSRMEGKLSAVWNEKEIPCEKTVRYAQVEYFGEAVYFENTFRITLDCAGMDPMNRLRFELEKDGTKETLPIVTRNYTSRITSAWKKSYWCFGQHMVSFGPGRVKREIVVEKCGFLKHVKKEISALGCMMLSSPTGLKMCRERIRYWKAWPQYHGKNIWLTFDKIYKGGDNGEYLYKYMMTRKDTDVIPVYLINKDAADRRRLEEEGYQPLIYGSEKHRLMFLYAKMILATHAGIYNFNNISEKEVPYLQDLMNAEAVCIQHGLSVQNLAFSAHRAFNNNKRYYCASKYEAENLLQPIYGYDDPSVIRLTGLARYDGLISNDKRQILITPTWRNYIANSAPGKNNSRPYLESFKETEYFKIYNGLITDKKLLETAKRCGYRILYLVHPNICQQARDYSQNEGIEIISALEVNYEKVLTESSLMVTDYSGVQFDFAYMRKPVVYFHTPKLPPHYVEGGFFYDTQGFGEICTEHEELVDVLCEYMENECKLKPFYEQRENDFFAFSDHDNCRRIFEDALEYQKEKGNRK